MRPSSPRCRCLAVALWSVAIAVGAPARGQQVAPRLRGLEPVPQAAPHPSGHAVLLGANMLVSGLTSGTLNWHRGGSFRAGFARGALGGAASYGGKVLAVKRGTAAPFFGRQLAAVGASAVRNAGQGQQLLSDVSLPLGPLHLHLVSGGPQRAWVSFDVLGLASLAGALLSYDATIDWEASIAAAAPVLVVADPADRLPWNGRHVGGLLLLRDDRVSHRPVLSDETLAHERVHLLEYDQLAQLWSDPLERNLLGHWQFTRRFQQYVDLSLNAGFNVAVRSLPRRLNPVEIEADFLARTR